MKQNHYFFCRADKFSGHFEGSVPQKEFNYRLTEALKASEFFKIEFDLKKAKLRDKHTSNEPKNFKQKVIVNCWHINQNESDAMWQLYLKDSKGVAIETNVHNLELAFKHTNEIIQPSKVRYIDYDKEGWYNPIEFPFERYNMEFSIFHKRIEFPHENEFRLYHQVEAADKNPEYWDNQINHKRLLLSAAIHVLISKVYYHPKAAKDKIQDISRKLGYNFFFSESSLAIEPVY